MDKETTLKLIQQIKILATQLEASFANIPYEQKSYDLSRAYQIIKEFEGCVLHAYQDPGGVWTIGWGHTGRDVTPGQTITQNEADELFAKDIEPLKANLLSLLDSKKIYASTGEVCALLSFAYNCGFSALQNSTLFRLYCAGNKQAAADQFLVWTHDSVGHELPGLVRRRKEERNLFLS